MIKSKDKHTLIILLGPTASGKTAIGTELAEWLGTEIISADSRQVFRELNIGAAKPTEDQLRRVRHHLVSHVSVTEDYNAGRFEQEALKILAEIFKTKPVVLMVGGSGLYINALCHGLDNLPGSDPEIRKRLKEQFALKGIGFLQKELKRLDPGYYMTVDLANPNRLMRAIEVSLITGRAYSSFRQEVRAIRAFDVIKIGLNLPREELIRRIHIRTDEMMKAGLLEEVRSLLPFRSYNALNTVGYRELFEYLDGKCTLEEAVEKIKTNTRRYAKRQMTWFRKDNDIRWFHPEEMQQIKGMISADL